MHCFATQTPSYNASHRQQTSTASSPDKLDRAPTPSVKPLYSLRENAVFCEFISDFCVRQAPRLRIEPAVETGNGRRRGAAAAPVGMVWRRRWPVAISGSTPPAGAEAPFGTACLAGRHIRPSLIAGRFKPGPRRTRGSRLRTRAVALGRGPSARRRCRPGCEAIRHFARPGERARRISLRR